MAFHSLISYWVSDNKMGLNSQKYRRATNLSLGGLQPTIRSAGDSWVKLSHDGTRPKKPSFVSEHQLRQKGQLGNCQTPNFGHLQIATFKCFILSGTFLDGFYINILFTILETPVPKLSQNKFISSRNPQQIGVNIIKIRVSEAENRLADLIDQGFSLFEQSQLKILRLLFGQLQSSPW